MENENRPGFVSLIRKSGIVLAIWAVFIVLMFAYEAKDHWKDAEENALISARSLIEKDIMYRKWNALHGGVYAPVTESTPPNPYLTQMPERDITTPSGRKLTLINPAYMTRQVHELENTTRSTRGHITSLKLLRPENKPDDWEVKALNTFEQGASEAASVEVLEGKSYMRVMRPLNADKACLKCHAFQGYKEGEIRGAISASIPMQPFNVSLYKSMRTEGLLYLFYLVIGSGLIISRTQSEERKKLVLSQSEERHRMMYNNTPAMLHSIDRDGRLVSVSDYWLAVMGYEREEVLGRRSSEFLTEASRRHAIEVVLPEFMKSGSCKDVEYQFVKKNGEVMDVLLSAISERDAGGTVVRSLAVIQDITKRKLMEKARLESEERYKTLFTRAGDGIFTMTVDGSLVEVNDSLARMHGYSQQEMLRMNLKDLDTPETTRQVADRMRRLLAGESLTFEVEHYHKDGHIFPLEVSASLIRYGDRSYIQSFHRDITERKRAEDALRKSEERLHVILESTADGILAVNAAGKTIMTNKRFAELWRIPQPLIDAGDDKGMLDCVLAQLTHPEAFINKVKALYNSAEIDRDIIVFKDGRTFERYSAPLRYEGAAIGRLWSFRDVTEKLKLEDQLRQSQKMESVGTLAGGIAHDFNNILTAIIGYGHIALMKLEHDNPQRQNIKNILTAADRATYLTQGLLAFSRKQMSNKKQIDLNDVMKKTENFLSRIIGEDIEFRTNLHDAPLMVFADPNQIEQVLMNLATNARDAMSKGGVLTVAIESARLGEEFSTQHGFGKPGLYGMITVSDTGIGMSEEIQQRMFEPFFTTKEVGRGTGLGLAIIYGIMKQHEGFITVDSGPDKGTTFRMYLPIIESAVSETVKSEETASPVRGKETILLAEDEETLRELWRSVFEEFGYEVIVAVDGEDAVKKFSENKDRIHLFVSDLIMPKKNGKEAYDEIIQMRPDIKAVFASGYSPDIVRNRTALRITASIIYKPISPMDLLKKVRSVLDEGTTK